MKMQVGNIKRAKNDKDCEIGVKKSHVDYWQYYRGDSCENETDMVMYSIWKTYFLKKYDI